MIVAAATASAQQQRPNIIVIMGDDIGWFNIGAYHQGMMASRTPNLDRLAAEGMRFTDYYAEASCTAGRANFITGELPIRTGLTTVGQAGSPLGMPDEAPTIATVLKSMGYATGQFGKNHLGDLNQFLPTLHGFDEFYGYLYHLDAMEDPCHPNYPPALKATVGPRNMLHSYATNVDDPTVQPRWGKVGKQRIEDAGELCPKRMETVDDEILSNAFAFIDKAKRENKSFFVWLNPTRMHVVTHLSEKYEKMRTPENGWTIEEGGMAQLDDIVGSVMQKVKDFGIDNDTILAFTTDNGAENFTWPDGGRTPFAGAKGTVLEGGFRVPMLLRWPGKVPAGKIENQIVSGLDWFPTLVSAAGNPNIVEELKKGKEIDGRTTRSISTAMTRPTCSPARASRSETRFSISRRRRWARCASMTSSTASSISRGAGSAPRSRSTGRSSSISASIPSSARASADRWHTTIGSPTSSGASSSSTRRSPPTPRPSSTSRRCKRARASISKP
jgi:arylsulfatase